jgi:hypothetical protein
MPHFEKGNPARAMPASMTDSKKREPHKTGGSRMVQLQAADYVLKRAVQGSTFTVEKLQSLCEGYLKFPNSSEVDGPCLYYVLGSLMGSCTLVIFVPEGDLPPRNVRLPTMVRAILDDLRGDPVPLPKEMSASTVVYRALTRAYPCKW